MRLEKYAISDLKLCTEGFLATIVDKVSRYCGIYTCCRCKAFLYTLCNTCAQSISYATPSCPICEKFSIKGEVHEQCRIKTVFYTHSISCFNYTKTVKCLFRVYKYEGAFQYQRVLEELILHYFRYDPFLLDVSWEKLCKNRRIALIPVPMTKKKQANRGFSPAYEIMLILARIIERVPGAEIAIFPTLVVKKEDIATQAKKKRMERLLSLHKTYAVNDAEVQSFCHFQPQIAIVVDDIVTTGATTNIVIEQIANNTFLRQTLKKVPILRFTFASA